MGEQRENEQVLESGKECGRESQSDPHESGGSLDGERGLSAWLRHHKAVVAAGSIAVSAFALVLCFCTLFFKPEMPNVQGLDCVKEIFAQETFSNLKRAMPVETNGGKSCTLEHPFYDVDGVYSIWADNGKIDRVIFRWDKGADTDKIEKSITDVIGDYTDYDSEYDEKIWETPWLKVSLYPDSGIWFDITSDVPSCEEEGHDASQYGDWKNDYDGLVRSRPVSCSKCGFIVDEETEEITSFVNGKKLMIDPQGFMDRFEEKSQGGIKGYSFDSKKVESGEWFYSDKNYLVYSVSNEDNADSSVGMCQFVKQDGSSVLYSEQLTDDNMVGVLFLIDKASDVSAVVFATVMAIDPSLEYSECVKLGQKVVDRVGKKKGVTKNHIRYVLLKQGNYHYLLAKVA